LAGATVALGLLDAVLLDEAALLVGVVRVVVGAVCRLLEVQDASSSPASVTAMPNDRRRRDLKCCTRSRLPTPPDRSCRISVATACRLFEL